VVVEVIREAMITDINKTGREVAITTGVVDEITITEITGIEEGVIPIHPLTRLEDEEEMLYIKTDGRIVST